MRAAAIRVHELGKRYRLRQNHLPNNTLRDALSQSFRAGVHAVRGSFVRDCGAGVGKEWFWALRGLAFEVPAGQVVGILGANGAGKSTLLKLLSRITEPTTGSVEIRGRVGSLIEVGTGFHSELTGRENTYLNGAILGMRRSEIDRKFDEIVAFAGVERFVDTPLKHYSSGMQLRLGFAVAAHLDTEILIVDEVLAVGDAEFQRKCLSTITRVARQGRTVLFVSHNPSAVKALCERVIWLKKGELAGDGATGPVLSSYLTSNAESISERVLRLDPDPNTPVTLMRLAALPELGAPGDQITTATNIVIQLDYWSRDSPARVAARIAMFNEQQVLLFESADTGPPVQAATSEARLWRAQCHVPGQMLAPGVYRVEVSIQGNGGDPPAETENLYFTILDSKEPEAGADRGRPGVLRPSLQWQCGPLSAGEHERAST